MDYNLLAIIKKEKLIEEKNDNYSSLSCDVHVKVEKIENGFDDCTQNSVLSNSQRETFNYDNFKEEKQSCSICRENFINSYSLYKHNLRHLKVPLVRQKVFICDVCSTFCKTKKQLQHHITKAHDDKTLYTVITVQCPKCPKIYHKNSLTRHLQNCHGTFQCKICKSVYKSKHYLSTHMKRVHDDDGMLDHCDICRKSFKSPRKVRIHKKNSHNYQEVMTIQCPKCPKILNCKKSLKVHLKNCHSEGMFQCKICKSVFKSKAYLSNHMWIVHYNDGMLHHCDICGKSFKSPYNMRLHKKRSHTYQEGMTVQCPKCPKILNCKSSLTEHIKIFHSEGTFQCKYCKSVFKCKRYLLIHVRTVHDDDGMLHSCDICGKSFKSPRKLRLHKKYSHTYQEGMTIQCPKCPKILKKSYLKSHLKNCHSEGTFQCKICKSVLKTKLNLLAHMRRVHDDDGMLHHCDICGKSFKSPRKVRMHKKKIHSYLNQPVNSGVHKVEANRT